MRAVAIVSLLLSLFAAGCFSSPTPPSGTIKCSSDPSRLCPRSYVCVNGFCDLPSSSGDGGTDAGSDGG